MPNDQIRDIRSSIVFRSAAKKDTEGNTVPIPRSFSLKDYKWNENYQISGENSLHNNYDVPKLVLVERQPVKKIDWSKIVSALQAIDSVPGISQLLQTSLSPFTSLSQTVGANYINSLSDEYSSNKNKADELLNISDLEKLIEGPVVATYEIPFFNETYLRSNNRDGWSVGSAIESAGQLTDLINDGFQLNILKTPQWQNTGADGMDWEVEFYLINNDLDSLAKNFQFIHAMYPSTQWIRMKGESLSGTLAAADNKGLVSKGISTADTATGGAATRAIEGIDQFLAYTKSPNIFRVECPGRFLQLFVAIDMEVSYVGGVRSIPLYKKLADQVPITLTEGMLYPDAYRVRLSARDLTPNCYNVYANYLMSQELVTVDAETQSLSAKGRNTALNIAG